MRIDLNLLYALDALLEEGSVVGAARRMHLSSPTMSRTLARIRETTQDPILVQSGRELVPTQRALEIRASIKQAIQQATCVLAPRPPVELQNLESHFNVRANDIFIGTMAGKLVDAMKNEIPRARLCFTPEENDIDDEALRSGRIDLFISASRQLGTEIRIQPLFSTRIVGVATVDHPIFENEITPQRLVQWGHITISRRGKSHGPIDEILSVHALKRRVQLVVSTPGSALQALNGTDLILPVAEHLARSVQGMGVKIRIFDLPLSLPEITITQAWHPRYQNDLGHQWLRRTIRALAVKTFPTRSNIR
ncbi:TPA: LysR family transcriptional regulator [Pluralibacter gergoviae]|uniref:LysR family transcriptional regulator n=1 Tax=Pluralibacter gergoviae TaxID=61647 RepID=A0A0J5L099_PLUGE|nr:LysR family transcriptional regulator [Pluralibacter gergoviae]EKV0931181.1 LysR family transcriptional regulator [Pluralibacter gergoviae]EKV6250049.1 LysR family transcriptional regulator [Pluralibacter gergoviae]EKW9967591.1 LysR family transcriptional regulator [Pluralibacter gergoviae]ELD4270702.1 LysR family transcriptional regulator [Pluralibacter gergoviae]ELD4276457.1 LysR family transcriptional regulator [Pluralibacter gergoviae]